MKNIFLLIILYCICSCNDKETVVLDENTTGNEKLFIARTSQVTNLNFVNTVIETEYENYENYPFIYNGSGVAVGDINNDGLPDIYFAGNSSDDKLFVNEGNLSFKDISVSSGIDQFKGWSTGVTMIDINSDGWLDIYVCRAGPSKDTNKRINRLFINNQDGTFLESAGKYGLDSKNYSVQSAFFDYDLDGDLDLYILNHPEKKREKSLTFMQHKINVASGKTTTDVFYENIDGVYIDKTKEANMFNYGYRHGIAVGDVNKDGYPDLYISSDFDDPDILYINQKNKSFEDRIDEYFRHISFNSMGNELVDINNDQLLDLYVVDMAPNDHFRSKAYMASMDVDRFRFLIRSGNHHQYMFNTLQLNNGNASFSEIGQFSNIAKTDWSWAPLFFDMDHDGLKDLFITNGIKENYLYRDIAVDAVSKYGENYNLSQLELLDVIPSDISENIFYKNIDGVSFDDKSSIWSEPSMFNSNGVSTADFDNDGDLDFVINNVDDGAILYESRASNGMGGNSVKIILEGDSINTSAIGSKIEVITKKYKQWHELFTSRGYLSSVDTPMIFGMGTEEFATINVIWPDGSKSSIVDAEANNTYRIKYGTKKNDFEDPHRSITLLTRIGDVDLNFKHEEDNFDDYTEQILLPHSQSNVGPSIIKGDVNGDGLEDVFIGGAARQEARLFLQNSEGRFKIKKGDWELHKIAEDTGAVFFDFENDGDLDLYIVSGGAHREEGHFFYTDRLYINDGEGNFKYNQSLLPNISISGKAVCASDIDNDGDIDLFVGGRIVPNKYPTAPQSYFLINDNNKFNIKEIDVNQMVSSALFSDFDNDGDDDLITVGEWSSILFFNNENGNFSRKVIPGLESTRGLWFSIAENDIDNDGDMDYFAGNLGLNTKFKANKKKKFHIYAKDFDDTGTFDIVLSSNYKGELVPSRGRECSSQQMPFISDKFKDFKSFASASLSDIYGEELNDALHYEANILYSVFIQNNGNGNFEIIKLPWQAQVSPVNDFEFTDIDFDGKDEIILVGNLFNVEVETERYDSSIGVIFKFEDGIFKAINYSESGFNTSGDAREIITLNNGNGKLVIVTNNNGELDIFRISENNPQNISGT